MKFGQGVSDEKICEIVDRRTTDDARSDGHRSMAILRGVKKLPQNLKAFERQNIIKLYIFHEYVFSALQYSS